MNVAPIRIMVVEDEVLIGMMVTKKLRSFGYEVDEVITTGEEAVERAGKYRPDIILMDVTLAGDLDGLEAARVIKEQYGIPIIIFSGYTGKSIYEKTRAIDPAAVLKKMDPIPHIASEIERVLKNR